VNVDGRSLLDHLTGQWSGLCALTGVDPVSSLKLLCDAVGSAATTPLSGGPVWTSDVADDHTPIEFSVAFNQRGRPTLRLLAETQADRPGAAANLAAGYAFVDAQYGRPGFRTHRLDGMRDLFTSERPQGHFGLWHSLVFRPGDDAEFKVYLNPEMHGIGQSPAVVAEAMHRLGLTEAYHAIVTDGLRPGELGRADRLSFFALDLRDDPRARIKLYVSQYHAGARDVVRAARVVDGIDPAEAAELCVTAGGRADGFDGRPLISSFTLAPGHPRPVGYSLYVPIRSYVNDDEEARDRVATVLLRHGFHVSDLDRAVDAVARRPLDAGVGLLAHVSLRLGRPHPGVSVYLSAEAYHVQPPLRQSVTVH
jgi:DMATS type aromatic prenyltransferase